MKPKAQLVGALLVNTTGQVLLGLRSSKKTSWPDRWDAIGGHVNPGETLEAALIRELREEIGVSPVATQQLEAVELRAPDSNEVYVYTVFAVTAWEGAPWIACDEHSELRWFGLPELQSITNLASEEYIRLAGKAIAARRTTAGFVERS